MKVQYTDNQQFLRAMLQGAQDEMKHQHIGAPRQHFGVPYFELLDKLWCVWTMDNKPADEADFENKDLNATAEESYRIYSMVKSLVEELKPQKTIIAIGKSGPAFEHDLETATEDNPVFVGEEKDYY